MRIEIVKSWVWRPEFDEEINGRDSIERKSFAKKWWAKIAEKVHKKWVKEEVEEYYVILSDTWDLKNGFTLKEDEVIAVEESGRKILRKVDEKGKRLFIYVLPRKTVPENFSKESAEKILEDVKRYMKKEQ